MQNFFYKDIWRMDWGLGNPNKTAALIAMLMIAVWGLTYIRKWGFWAALALFTGLGVCLIHTFSRGGIIALFFGILPLIWFAPRPWPKNKWIGIVISIWIMIGASIYLSAHERYGKGTEDRSIANRLELWKFAPQMMADAPEGWGLGRSGKMYMEWYQPLDRGEVYRTMVNSHLTWLVEFGWPMRAGYVLAWLLVLTVSWPINKHEWMVIPWGIWMTFFIAAIFSSVAESPWLWIVPIISLCAITVTRIRENKWPNRLTFSAIAVVAASLISALYFIGNREGLVHKSSEMMVFGKGDIGRILVVDPKSFGQIYGRKIRILQKESNSTRAIAIAESIEPLPDCHGKTVILARTVSDKRRLTSIMADASRVIIVSPTFFPQEISLSPEALKKVEVIFGEFSQLSTVDAWEQSSSVSRLEGVGDFIPNWLQLYFQL